MHNIGLLNTVPQYSNGYLLLLTGDSDISNTPVNNEATMG